MLTTTRPYPHRRYRGSLDCFPQREACSGEGHPAQVPRRQGVGSKLKECILGAKTLGTTPSGGMLHPTSAGFSQYRRYFCLPGTTRFDGSPSQSRLLNSDDKWRSPDSASTPWQTAQLSRRMHRPLAMARPPWSHHKHSVLVPPHVHFLTFSWASVFFGCHTRNAMLSSGSPLAAAIHFVVSSFFDWTTKHLVARTAPGWFARAATTCQV